MFPHMAKVMVAARQTRGKPFNSPSRIMLKLSFDFFYCTLQMKSFRNTIALLQLCPRSGVPWSSLSPKNVSYLCFCPNSTFLFVSHLFCYFRRGSIYMTILSYHHPFNFLIKCIQPIISHQKTERYERHREANGNYQQDVHGLLIAAIDCRSLWSAFHVSCVTCGQCEITINQCCVRMVLCG